MMCNDICGNDFGLVEVNGKTGHRIMLMLLHELLKPQSQTAAFSGRQGAYKANF
jgi:hypothetical protein